MAVEHALLWAIECSGHTVHWGHQGVAVKSAA